MKLYTKLLILFLSIALGPAIFIGMLTYDAAKSRLLDYQLNKIETVARIQTEMIDSYFSGRQGDMHVYKDLPVIYKNLNVLLRYQENPADTDAGKIHTEIQEILSEVAQAYGYRNMGIFDMSGKTLFELKKTSEDVKKKTINQIRNLHQKNNRENIVTGDVYRNTDNVLLLPMWGAILNRGHAGGDMVGIILAEINIQELVDQVESRSGQGQTGETLIGKNIGGQTYILSALRHDPEGYFLEHPVSETVKNSPIQNAVKGESGKGFSRDYRGEEVIAAWRFIPELEWGLVSKIDTGEIIADINKLRLTISIVLGVIIFFVVVIALATAHAVSHPLQKLENAIRLISQGEWDVPVDSRSNDEIGHLASAFDQMRAQLKKSQEKIKEQNMALEKHVQEATQELELKVRELERFNKMAVGRELKMRELKSRIRELEDKNVSS